MSWHPVSVGETMPSKQFADLNEEMLKRLLDINPDLGTEVGLHDPYDDLLPHGGAERYLDSLRLLQEWNERAQQATKDSSLTVDERIGLKGLGLAVDMLRFSIDEYPIWKMYPDALATPGALLFIMLTREYAPYETRAASMASRLKKLPRFLQEFRTRFKGARSVRVWTELAIDSCEQFPAFLDFLLAYSKDRLPERILGDLSAGVDCAKEAIREQKDWLEHLRDGAEMNFPMGRERFEKMIELRMLGLTPDEMLALGEKYLRKFKEERTEISERIAPGKGVEGAKEKVASNAPKSFDEGLRATIDSMEKAKKFIMDNQLATVDPDAKLIVTETPRFMAPIVPYAALFMPSLFDARQEGEYIVTRPKDPNHLGIPPN